MSKTTYHALHLHFVFSTNRRKRCIKGNVKIYLYEALRALFSDSGGQVLSVGGTTDHVHILASMPLTVDLSKTIQKIKSTTTRWLNERYFSDDKFRWAKGYAVFSVSQSVIGKTIRYIDDQWDIHKSSTFKEELTRMLKAHNMELDTWDGPVRRKKREGVVESG
ncbi:MAG: IS200/IS605 family transposase [Cyclonatronaceae bacterium]